jgi:ferredoxin-thioredoxin reductase catalytic subunit/rubredoxin
LSQISIDAVRARAEADARTNGYYLIPDQELLQLFLEGLKVNEERYGYPTCPCRLASGKFEFDRDIICPCDYRDPDVQKYGACYCRLYVTKKVFESKDLPSVPERRPLEKQAPAYQAVAKQPEQKPGEISAAKTPEEKIAPSQVKQKLWYCKQCGYVTYREEPPYLCPICKARKELFAELKTTIEYSG